MGCLDCNRWGRPGDDKLVMELMEDDLEALRQGNGGENRRTAETSKGMAPEFGEPGPRGEALAFRVLRASSIMVKQCLPEAPQRSQRRKGSPIAAHGLPPASLSGVAEQARTTAHALSAHLSLKPSVRLAAMCQEFVSWGRRWLHSRLLADGSLAALFHFMRCCPCEVSRNERITAG